MVGIGARGGTRSEILQGLKFNEANDEAIGKSYNAVISGFQVFALFHSVLPRSEFESLCNCHFLYFRRLAVQKHLHYSPQTEFTARQVLDCNNPLSTF